MSTERVCFPKTEYDALGRNGYVGNTGLEVSTLGHAGGGEVWLQPVTTKGEVGKARLVFPVSQMEEVFAAIRRSVQGVSDADHHG